MASAYWIKLYHELLHERKIATLDDHLWRRMIECFLMAGEQSENGNLPDFPDIVWLLRTTEDELKTDFNELVRIGVLEIKDDRYYVKNFYKRQEPMEKAEYMKRLREEQKREDALSNMPEIVNGYQPVTNSNGDTELTDTETEKPADAGTSSPTSLEGWLEILKNGTNKQAILMRMTKTLYPDLVEYPTYSYIGKVARDIGGAGRLAALLWECVTRNPKGDILSYIQAYAKGRKSKTEPAGYAGLRDYAKDEGWSDGEQT